jgi:hypothetical protein
MRYVAVAVLGLLSVSQTACTSRVTDSEDVSGATEKTSSTSTPHSSSAGGAESTAEAGDSTSEPSDIFWCLQFESTNPWSDPSASPNGTHCAPLAQDECTADELCTAVFGRMVGGCGEFGEPTCSAGRSFIGCVSWEICKPGTNFFCEGGDPSVTYFSNFGCIPYGFANCETFEDTGDSEQFPPTCAY